MLQADRSAEEHGRKAEWEVKDCKIVITVRNGVINIEGQGVSLEEQFRQ